ncbi:prostaglandin E2 receptor EP4 subtype-like [Mugil cephalus]|uniref:prostaglandin E2 receptor EP4 subtype-like n=1 Tax=Mugil cephalus TaxID=48193 RepID=UPI001FB681B6|nr:prostaglandin E2 receptor EP4 subtype-like [Mugil cephalus]
MCCMEGANFTHGTGNETQIALPMVMFAGGAAGNLIAIIVLSVSRQERKSSAFFTLVCGLAVTDLLGTCLTSPLILANYLDRRVLEQQHVCEFQSFLLLFFGLTGLSIICTMAAERYMAICWPYTYQRWGVDRRFAQKFLFCIYMSHIFFCCLPMMGMAKSTLQQSSTWCFIDWKKHDPVSTAYFVLYGVVSLLLILGTILLNLAVCGALLLMRQRTVQRPVTRTSVRERWRVLSSAAETQMMTVLLMTSVVVLACSAPLVVRVFANCFMQETDPKADLAAIRIAAVNPILDPWIYILLRRSLFRRLLGLSRRGSSSRSNPPPSPQSNLLCPDIMRDSHVFSQLMCNANIITQLPATVKFTSHDVESNQKT